MSNYPDEPDWDEATGPQTLADWIWMAVAVGAFAALIGFEKLFGAGRRVKP